MLKVISINKSVIKMLQISIILWHSS